MSAAELLVELATAGVFLRRVGADLIVETRAGAAAEPYREQITTHKSELLEALQAHETATRRDLDPSLTWVSVYRGPVDASQPPAGWNGIAPAGCGVPNACKVLGPCRHYGQHGRCWKGSA